MYLHIHTIKKKPSETFSEILLQNVMSHLILWMLVMLKHIVMKYEK